MSYLQQLLSFHIIELDKNNKIYVTWTYPTIDDATKTVILNKCNLKSNKFPQFIYYRNNFEWIYVTNTEVYDSKFAENIKSFSLVIVARDFSPEKYSYLGRILSRSYYKKGDPVELVRLYLSVYTTDSCNTLENGTFVIKDFENMTTTKLRELINLFRLEIILIYTAILLKKRIILYHHSSETLLKWLPAVTSFANHRNPNNYLFPIMEITKDDLNELKNSKYYVAGFTDSNICSKTELFDILVNFPATEITIAPQAKESLTMTKLHKDIAIFMVQLAENQNLCDSDIVREISGKTNELLTYLKSLSNKKTDRITVEDIKSKNLHPAVESFLYSLAVSENLLY